VDTDCEPGRMFAHTGIKPLIRTGKSVTGEENDWCEKGLGHPFDPGNRSFLGAGELRWLPLPGTRKETEERKEQSVRGSRSRADGM
jgi:hypothetical protein